MMGRDTVKVTGALIASALLCALASSALTSVATASHRPALEQISTGPNNDDGPYGATFLGTTPDGAHAFFQTLEQLVPEDYDGHGSIYQRADGTTRLVNISDTGLVAPAYSLHFSDDGQKVFFETTAGMVPQDTDGVGDLYERSAGTTKLASGLPVGNCFGACDTRTVYSSPDGERVIFETGQPLVSEDQNGTRDVYVWNGSTVELASSGAPGGFFSADYFGAASTDGQQVLFLTLESLSPDDTDACPSLPGCYDLYERTETGFRLRSGGGNGPFHVEPFQPIGAVRASADGDRVFFQTNEPLTPFDTDAENDVYVNENGVTTLVTRSPGPGAPHDAALTAISEDGAIAIFVTREALVPEDTDTSNDLYRWSNGSIEIVSTGPAAGANGPSGSRFQAASADGSRVIFLTQDSLVPYDTDSANDLYERHGNQTTLLSTGPSDIHGNNDVSLAGVSDDATHVLFNTAERLLPADTDALADAYERFGDELTLVSAGSPGTDSFAFGRGLSGDGRRAFFESTGRFVADDLDDEQDVYALWVNHAPRCDDVVATPSVLRHNRRLTPIELEGATDPDGDQVELTIDGVTQDEPVRGRGDSTTPDARAGSQPDQVRVRAERSNRGDGRVYQIAFTASDGEGGSCSGAATVGVPRQRNSPAIDSAPPSYDSFGS